MTRLVMVAKCTCGRWPVAIPSKWAENEVTEVIVRCPRGCDTGAMALDVNYALEAQVPK